MAAVTLVHLIAFTAEETITPLTYPDFVIGLEFVTPMAVVAEKGVAFIARYLYPHLGRRWGATVQTVQFASSAVVIVFILFVVSAALGARVTR